MEGGRAHHDRDLKRRGVWTTTTWGAEDDTDNLRIFCVGYADDYFYLGVWANYRCEPFYFTVHPNKVFEINLEDLWAPILHWCLDIKPAVQTWWKYFVLVKTIFEWSQFLHYLLYGQIYRTSKIIKSNYIYKWNKHWRCSSICKAWKFAWFKVQGSTTRISKKNIYSFFSKNS